MAADGASLDTMADAIGPSFNALLRFLADQGEQLFHQLTFDAHAEFGQQVGGPPAPARAEHRGDGQFGGALRHQALRRVHHGERVFGLPALVVRGVSDTAGQRLPHELAGIVDDAGRTRAWRAAALVLLHPGLVGPALVLRRGAALAVKAVAAVIARLAESR